MSNLFIVYYYTIMNNIQLLNQNASHFSLQLLLCKEHTLFEKVKVNIIGNSRIKMIVLQYKLLPDWLYILYKESEESMLTMGFYFHSHVKGSTYFISYIKQRSICAHDKDIESAIFYSVGFYFKHKDANGESS